MAKVLIVDDDHIIQKIMTVQLQRDGHHVFVAEDGPMAITLAQQQLPDVILMDMRLPGMDGCETTTHLKANAATAHIPVVAQTAANSTHEHQRLRAAGCTAILVKPVQLTELQAVLAELLP